MSTPLNLYLVAGEQVVLTHTHSITAVPSLTLSTAAATPALNCTCSPRSNAPAATENSTRQ